MKTREDWLKFDAFVRRRGRVRRLEWVNLTQLIEGRAASLAACVTRFGVLTGVVQGQIVDQPELSGLRGRSGVWLGHDWSGQRFSETVQRQAEKIAVRLGEHLEQKGYKGIFGIDLIVDKHDQVWLIECNSRYTGAFPAYTWASLKNGEMPLDYWHLAEFLGVDYDMDFARVQQQNRQPKQGAQILLHNLEGASVRVGGEVKAGPRWNLLQLQGENDSILTDGVPKLGAKLKPAERLGRLLFNRAIVDDSGRLLPEIQRLVKELYGRFQLAKI